MKLDLSGAKRLDPERLHELAAIAALLRRPFTELIGKLSEPHGDDVGWWVTPLASRNIFSCSLYFRCCTLLLAARAASDGKIGEIVVESAGLAEALRGALAATRPDIQVSVHQGAWRFRAKQVAGMAFRLAAALYHFAGQIACARLFGRHAKPEYPAAIALLDTFLYRDSFNGPYRDRHYPGLTDLLSNDERQRVFFLASYYKIRNYARFFRALRASGENFLVKEDFLRPSDYAFALAQPFRLARFRVRRCALEGLEVAPMVNDALEESFASSGSLEGLLRYRLARRIRDAGIRVRCVIEWFENQEIDHGSVAGLRRFLPEARITGYQGFVLSPHYLSIFPSAAEFQRGLLPHRLAVTGEALIERAREFCPELPVCAAPAFRFAGLWREPSARQKENRLTILVALPLMQDEASDVVAMVAAVGAGLTLSDGRPWRMRVKPHPSASGPMRSALAKRLRQSRLELAGDGFDGLLDDADVLLSNASTVCVQAVARGVPVVVVGNPRGLTLNPIPDGVAQDLWIVCHEPAQVAAAIRSFAERDVAAIARGRALGREVRKRYFARVTRAGLVDLLGLDDKR